MTGDNCGVASVVNNALAQFPQGETVVTWTVTDTSGNTATANQLVTVNDAQPPTITCLDDITVANGAGICGAVVTYIAPVGTDNCPGATTAQTEGLASGAIFPIGTTVNTFEVTDAAGLKTSCSFTVTVTDTQNPTITCLDDITVANDAGVCGAVVTYMAPVGTDNCPGATTVQMAGLASGATFPVGTTMNTFQVTDAAGNTASCSFTVTVNDDENPTLTAPAAVVVNTDADQCSATGVTLGTPTASDNCGVASVSNDAPAMFPKGTTTVTWTVTDSSGKTATATQTVTVEDHQAPVITCPTDVTLVAGSSGSAEVTWDTPSASDNCEVVSVTCSPVSGSTFTVGSTTVSCVAADAAGNTVACSFTVTVLLPPEGCETIQADPDRSRVHFDRDGDSEFAFFRGNLRLTDGDLASDFRLPADDIARGTLKVTIGGSLVFDKELTFRVHDHRVPANDREKWEYNGGPKEKMFLRWKDDQEYDATRDPNLPSSAATGFRHLGKLETRFINTDETRFRYEFKAVNKPITLTVDGLVLLTVKADGTVTSPFPFWKYGKAVEVLFPGRLVPGNVVTWYADGDLTDNGGLPQNLIYQHDAAANGNATGTYFNAGGRFFIKVPVAGVNLTSPDKAAKVEFSIGEAGVTTLKGCGEFTLDDYHVVGRNWKFNDGDDDCESED